MDNQNDNHNGNGHDRDGDGKIIQFRTLVERDRVRKEQLKQEEAWRKQYKAARHEPFLKIGNIPLFTKIFTGLILIVNLPLFFFPSEKLQAIYMLGFIPAKFTQRDLSLDTLLSPFTHLVLHGDVTHLIFNTVMMLALGTFFEKAMGTRRTIIFFFLCGVLGAVFYLALQPISTAPVVGASGAISGLFGAVIMIMYANPGMVQMGRFVRYGPWPVLLFWLGLMILMGVFSGGTIAWQAHVGGFISGVLFFYGFQKGWLRF